MILPRDFVFSQVYTFMSQTPNSGLTSALTFASRSLFVDEAYSTVPLDMLKAAIGSNPLLVPSVGAQPLAADCDDFVLELKSHLTQLVRQMNAANGSDEPPPAAGMVFSLSHAVAAVIVTGAQGAPFLLLIDPSDPNLPMTTDPANAGPILRTLPIQWIYF